MIPTRLLNLLLLAALALAAGRFLSFLRQPPPRLPEAATSAREQERAAPVPEATSEPPPAGTERYDVIAARDLFSPTRGVVPPAPETAARPAPPPQPPPKLTLYGVVILDNEKSAFLQEGVQETKPRKVKEGERFAGGVVSAIRPDGVTFQFAGKDITVALRTPKEGIAPTPVTPGGQPGGAVGGMPTGTPAVFPRQFTPPAVRQAPAKMPQQLPVRVQPGVPQVPPMAEMEEDLGEDEEYFEDDGSEELDEGDFEDTGDEDVEE